MQFRLPVWYFFCAATTQEGIYRVPYLNVGTYVVTYQAPGFKTLTRRDIPIRSSEILGVDVSMEVGNVIETVEVSASAQLLETETASTGHLVSGHELTTLPDATDENREHAVVRLGRHVAVRQRSRSGWPLAGVPVQR